MHRGRNNERLGFTIVELLVVIGIIGLLASFILPAIGYARARARNIDCCNRLKQLGVAEHSALASLGAFPTSRAVPSGPGFGLDRLVLPMKADRSSFACPADTRSREGDFTSRRSYYQNDGDRFRKFDRTGFNSDRDSMTQPWIWHDTRAADIVDGLSNTAAVSEQLIAGPDDNLLSESQLKADGHRYFWYTSRTYADESLLAAACDSDRQSPYPFSFVTSMIARLGYDHILPPNRIGCLNGPYNPTDVDDMSVALPANSQHGGYVNVLFADGAVRSVSDPVDIVVWRAMGTRAGSETSN